MSQGLLPETFRGRLTAIVLLGLGIRLLHLALVAADNPLSGDGAAYHLSANLFADGLGFPEPLRHFFGGVDVVPLAEGEVLVETPIGYLEPTAGHPPVWTVLLGTFAFLGFTTVLQQQLVSVLLGAPAIVLMGLLGRELRSDRLGLLAAAGTAGYAFIWVNDGLMMAETALALGKPHNALVELMGLEARAPTECVPKRCGATVSLAAPENICWSKKI